MLRNGIPSRNVLMLITVDCNKEKKTIRLQKKKKTVRPTISRICSPIMCLNERKKVRIDRKRINRLQQTRRCYQLSCPFPIFKYFKKKDLIRILLVIQ